MDDPLTRSAPERAVLEIVELTLRDLQAGTPGVARVTIDSRLDRDLALDSLARVELLLRIERAFAVHLPEETLQTADTVRDLLEAVRRATPRAADTGRRAPGPADEAQPRLERVRGETWQPATANTLLEVLEGHARVRADQTQIVCIDDSAPREITYAQLAGGARSIAAGLLRAGLSPGRTVAIMLPTSPDYFFVFFGVLMAGGIPVPIYPPARPAQLAEHVLRHRHILANAQAVMLVTVPEAALVARLLQAQVPGLRRVVAPADLMRDGESASPVAAGADDIALIQYTSGSTGNPKGVVLTHANLLANIRAMVAATAATPGDVFVSWLPLYHDMGLIGAFLSSLYVGFPLVVMSPLAFLSRPERWLRVMHAYRGTISAGPNFAYELCLKRLADAGDAALEGLDLSAWRLAFNGAEAVSPDTVQRFQARFAAYGLRPQSITPVYGLAESSVGLLFPPLGRGPLIDRVRREPFARSRRAEPASADDPSAQRFVACGRPLAGHEIRIVDESGREVGERVEGRLEFRGPSATAGYFHNAEETARLFHDGWLDTGDRAYLAGGEVYLTGRVKDIVIRGGRNLYPQEIEAAVGSVEGVRKGCVAVFGEADSTTGTERLVVLVETRAELAAARERLHAAIAQAVIDTIGEPPDEIVLAPPHTVLKTSSGKIRRSACRALYREGRIGAAAPTARVQALRLIASALGARLGNAGSAAVRAAYALYAALLFIALAVPTWAAMLLMPTPSAAWRLGRSAARLLLCAGGVRLTVAGLENLPRGGPRVVVSNHASYLDGLILIAALPDPHSFVVKRELDGHPVAGPFLRRLGASFVERFDVKRSVEDANQMVRAVSRGSSLLVFPEGTFVARSGLLPFHLGAFLTAAAAGVPVVPVTIRGSRELLPDGVWWPRRTPLEVRIAAALTLAPGESAELFARAVRLRQGARASIATGLGEAPA